MACYAALLSLYHTLNNINIHPRPPISLDQNQVESLTQNLTFFQHFLELHPSYEDDDLESRIKAASYAAEDLIETHIVDQIHAGSNISSVDLSQGLDVVIKDMDLIRKEVMQIKKHKDIEAQHQDQLLTNSSFSTASTWQSNITPVFDDEMINEVLDKLTGQQSSLQIIPIVGMGGIGKTTFATSIYTKLLNEPHFEICAWVTISQEYSKRSILQVLYKEVKGSTDGLSEMSEDEIGLIIYQHLWGRRYLIVLDDIWNVEAWEEVKSFFPDKNDGSRIMMTTRISNLASGLSSGHVIRMKFLDEGKSWDLLRRIVFGKLDCPNELEKFGKEIARKCRGLPLSIAVIGGLLRKSNMTVGYWIYTSENLNTLISLENDEYTLRLLRTSYKELSMHLKPCFLYMGIFPEDEEIKTSMLIRLWVAEGILRPVDDKSLEEVGKEYLKELIDRNLILISELWWDGEVRLCKIHDLLRDVCLREAQKQKFFCLLNQQKNHTPQDINMERRIFINPEFTNDEFFLHVVKSASLARSLLLKPVWEEYSPSLRFRLLRVYSSDVISTYSNNSIFEQANMRYLSMVFDHDDATAEPRLLYLFSLLWNLQTLKVYGRNFPEIESKIASKIWEMPLLRHVDISKCVLPDPPNGEHNYVLENLQILKRIKNLKFSEEVVRRIPNVKKLQVEYDAIDEGLPNFCLNNLGRLQKLESLNLGVSIIDLCDLKKIRRNLASFPHSLKMLSLSCTRISWEELTIRIGSLPLLQFLRLEYACLGPRWETIEGQFCNLRVLKLLECYDLKYWETDSSHFPRLEHLHFRFLYWLEKIPSSIGDIPTLKSIQLDYCSKSAKDSARRIKEEQEDYGNADLKLVIEENSSVEEAEEYSDLEDQMSSCARGREEYQEEVQVDSNEETQVDSDEENEEEDQVDSCFKIPKLAAAVGGST